MLDRHYPAYKGHLNDFYHFRDGFVFYDLTLGDGGHTEEALKSGCRVINTEVDPDAIKRAVSFITDFTPIIIDADNLPETAPDANWIIIRTNFRNLAEIAQKLNLPQADGIMIDLGPSQYQVLTPERGFSFLSDAPLDMRIDPTLGATARDLVNALNEGEIRELLSLGDEPFARQIARAIVEARKVSPIETTKQLADIVARAKRSPRGATHPATQTFMAFRMAVNLEREVISDTLITLPEILKTNGILGVISFHSGEDRLVKNFLKDMEQKRILSVINDKPIEPTADELQNTNRTRSAKLRLAHKI